MRLTQSEAAAFILHFAENPVVFDPIYEDILDTLMPGSKDITEDDFVLTVHPFSEEELDYLTKCKSRADEIDSDESWDDFLTSWDYHEYVFDNADGSVPFIHAVILTRNAVSYAYKNIFDVDVTVS